MYCASYPREELYVHTDRGDYVSGEILWFRVYAAERLTLKPSSISRIAYVELLNYDNRPVLRRSIYLDGGTGPGEFTLPDSLSSGVYQLRAYTAWMKNFLPGNCFRKEIIIYNAVSSQKNLKKPLINGFTSSRAAHTNFPGFLAEVNNQKDDNVEILIRTDDSFRASNNNVCQLVIETRGNISALEEIRLTGNDTRHLVPKAILIQGVNHIAFFTSSGKNIAERFIYIPKKNTPALKINSEDTFSKREKIVFKMESKKDIASGLSVSVSPPGYDQFPDLSDYLIFGSEFGDGILKELKGRHPDEMPVSAIDSMLLDARSNYVNWGNILSGNNPVIKYHPETDGQYLSGMLVNGKGVGDRVILSIPGKQAIFQFAETDDKGNFTFDVPIDGKTREIILEPDDMKGKAAVRLIPPFIEDYAPAGHVNEPAEFDEAIGVNYQVQRIYEVINSAPLNVAMNSPVVRRFYGKPDIELILADYIKLPTMDEIFFEIIPGTTLKERRTGYEIAISDPVTNLVYDRPPSLFIDGVRVADAALIANLDPEIVEEIDVMRERYFVGEYLFTGIVNVITKAGDFSAVNLPEYAFRTYYRVIDPVQKFLSPDYSSSGAQMKRIPDFRNTLWWNPSVLPGTTSELWSSDIKGDYKIVVNGLSGDGTPVSAEKIIRIK